MYTLVLVESIKQPRIIKSEVEMWKFEKILPRLNSRVGVLKLPNNEKVDLTHLVIWQLYDKYRRKVVWSG